MACRSASEKADPFQLKNEILSLTAVLHALAPLITGAEILAEVKAAGNVFRPHHLRHVAA